MKKLSLLVGMVVLLTGTIFGVSAMAAVRGTDVAKASNDCYLVNVSGTFSTVTKEQVLTRINQIRKEACDNGYVNPETGMKLKSSDYTPIKWSAELEWIAQTRAAEASVHQNHTRPNGASAFSIKRNGVSAESECLGFTNTGMEEAIATWYTEKAAWVAQNKSAQTGHYTSMINPEYKYVALGTFTLPDDFDVTAGEFSRQGANENKVGVVGNYDQTIEVNKLNLRIALPAMTVYKGYTLQAKLTATIVGSSVWGGSRTTAGYISSPITWTSTTSSKVSATTSGLLRGVAVGTSAINAKVGTENFSAIATCSKFTVGKGKTPKLKNVAKKKLKITYKAVKSAKGYQIQYSMKKNFKKKKKANTTAKTKTVKVKVGKKYYVRVRAYRIDPNGKKKYGKWSKKVSIKIKK